jgi:MFS family permease
MLGEILDGSFQAIRRNAKAMLGAALLAQTLGAIISAVLAARAGSQGESFVLWLRGLSPAELAALGFGVVVGALAFAIATVLISIVLQGAMSVPVARATLNRRTGFRQMWTLSRSRVGALLGLGGLMLLASVAVTAVFVGGVVLLANSMGGRSALVIVPLALGLVAAMMWIYIRLLLTPSAVVVEELGVMDGLRRSWQLTRHNWWRIFGITLVVALLIGIISQIVLIPVSLVSGGLTSVLSPHSGHAEGRALSIATGIASTLVSAMVAAAGYAFQTSVLALLYVDLRMRKEGLDLSLLQLLESGSDPDGVPGRGAVQGLPTGVGTPAPWPQPPYGQPPYGPPPVGR